MSIQNVYYERKVGTARACYVCNRPTQTVLATLNAEDFVYSCESHLTDPGFATRIAPTGPSADDIRKVISEYGAREARRTAAADKDKEEKKDEEKKEDKDKSMLSSLASAAVGAASSAASGVVSSFARDPKEKPASPPKAESPPPMAGVPSVPAQTHNKYALHRTFFESRKAQIRAKENMARAKEVSKGMPQVPRGFTS